MNTYTTYDPAAVEFPRAKRVRAASAVDAVELLGLADDGGLLIVDDRKDVVEVRHPITRALEAQVARIGF